MFTKNLKELRLKYNLTQKELAETLGTSQQTYMKWETGKMSPTLRTIEKIAEVFDIPISKLVFNNIFSIDDIFNAEYIDYLDQPLTQEEIETFKMHVESFTKTYLKHYSERKMTQNILLNNGKWASTDKKD
ncbi:helix-turn-helix domain-containing protein [Streptococcus ovis]|uniref:helix-turn-helix domain-containing protein n=1 Tax=Streptococcus ovis TaxID=82806 RepID=UPI0003769537|nr:helix-turn-helix domain-containing protein [Streptococcus ovis]